MDDPDGARLRIGDQERDAVVDQLRVHFAAGRLDLDEFEERTTRALSARTRGELVPLTVDLPAPASLTPAVRARRPLPVDPWSRAYSLHVRVAVLLAVVSVVIWIVSLGSLSPVVPILVIGASVGVHALARRVAGA